MKRLTLHIKSVLNKDESHYNYKTFLEKCLHQLDEKQSQLFFSWCNNVEIWRGKNSKRKVLCWKKSCKNLGC